MQAKQLNPPSPTSALICNLIEVAKIEEVLINRLSEAVKRNDGNEVFRIAAQLTGQAVNTDSPAKLTSNLER